jgi:hypothetical protein
MDDRTADQSVPPPAGVRTGRRADGRPAHATRHGALAKGVRRRGPERHATSR